MDLKEIKKLISQIAKERQIPEEKVLETFEAALAAAWKKELGKKGQKIEAKFDLKTGQIKFWRVFLVVKKEDLEKEGLKLNPEKHILLEEAKKIDPKIELGQELKIELKEIPKEFGRIASQTAKQVLIQKIREVEKETLYEEFKKKEGEIVSGIVQKVEPKQVIFDLGRTIGILPKSEQIPNEFYRPGQRLKAFVLKVEKTPKGAEILLSRAYPRFVTKLFELEVPEIQSKDVEIKSIAREAGSRTKIAVFSKVEGIDAIGACFPGKALVLMEDFTYKPIRELSKGQVVITHLGNRRKILKTYKRIWNGTLLRFKIFGVYEDIEVTKEHPLLFTPDYNGKIEFREASKIKKGYLAIPTLSNLILDKTIYHFEKEKDFLWVLGMYLAEGSLDKAEVNFTLSKNEKEKALKIKKIMEKYGGRVRIRIRSSRPSILDVVLSGWDWREIFKELGGEYGDRKKINSRLMFLEPKLQLNIFKGWIDGDGYQDKKRKRIIGVTTSKELLWQMYHILLRNGIRGNMQKRKKEQNKKETYQLEVALNKTKDYRGFFKGNYYFARIRSIEKVPSSAGRRVYNLEVEKDNSYIVYSIGVHNCVGQRGTRVQAVISELGGEKIDIIEYSEDPQKYIANALSPAKVLEVKILPKNKALAIVPDDQLSLAIGRDGQNVRLAAKLTNWKIDVKSKSQFEKEGVEEES